jgi:hypothetical protein
MTKMAVVRSSRIQTLLLLLQFFQHLLIGVILKQKPCREQVRGLAGKSRKPPMVGHSGVMGPRAKVSSERRRRSKERGHFPCKDSACPSSSPMLIIRKNPRNTLRQEGP